MREWKTTDVFICWGASCGGTLLTRMGRNWPKICPQSSWMGECTRCRCARGMQFPFFVWYQPPTAPDRQLLTNSNFFCCIYTKYYRHSFFLKQIQSCFYSSPTFVFSWSLLIFYTDRRCIYHFGQTWSCPSAKLSVFTIMPVLCEFVVYFYCALFSWLFPMARRKRENSRVYSAWTSTCLAPNRPSKCYALSVRILFPYKVPVLIQRELFLKLSENHLLLRKIITQCFDVCWHSTYKFILSGIIFPPSLFSKRSGLNCFPPNFPLLR